MRVRVGRVWAVMLLGLAAACAPAGQPTATPTAAAPTCATLPARIVDAIQDYVDSFGATDAAGVPGAVSARQEDFAATTADLRAQGEALRCDPEELADAIRAELERLEGGTPVQDAIAATFRSGPLGTADPSDLGAVQLTVGSSEDLVAALAVAGTGSVIRLAAGEYPLTQPLVLLRAVTIVGAGAAETVLTSTAPDGALVIATDGDAVVRDLALVHTGPAAASVVLVAGGGYVLERLRIAGGEATGGGGGYGVVLRPAANPLRAAGTRREITEVQVTGNPAGGIVVAGEEAPTVRDVTVDGSDGCGLCFVERSAGTVSGAAVTATQVGVRVDDDAAPTIAGVTVSASEVGIALTGAGSPHITGSSVVANATGVQVTGSGHATIGTTTVSDNAQVGVRVSGSSRPGLDDLTLTGATPVGIAVVGESAPSLTGGRIATTGEVGIVWAETGGGSASGVTIAGPRLGLQLSDDAAPTVDGVTVESAAAGSLLANGRSGGTVSGLTCAPGAGSVVAFADQTTLALTAPSGCEVIDQR